MTQATQDLLVGIFLGGDAVLVVLSILVAGAYRERLLLLHAGSVAAVIAVSALQASSWTRNTPHMLMLVMALACLHLQALTSHVGSLRQRQSWTSGGALAIALIAILDTFLPWHLLPVAAAVWILAATLVTLRAWPQSQPWIVWTVPGHLALVAAAVHLGLSTPDGRADPVLAGVLAFWAMALYLSSVWRSRVFGEVRSRQTVAATLNPLTRLSTPVVLLQRVESARSLMRRYGHPSTVLLVHVDYLDQVAAKLGAEAAEAAALEAGTRIRDALGSGDAGARVGPHRFAILSEGTAPPEAAGGVASRILTAGLRASLSGLEGNYLHLRIVLTDLPRDGVLAQQLLERMGEKLDSDVARAREKRIRAVPSSELMLMHVPGADLQVVPTTY